MKLDFNKGNKKPDWRELFMDIGEIIAWVIYLRRTSILSIMGIILYAFMFLPVLWVIVKLIKIIGNIKKKANSL